jgi:hypothetical protein
MADPDDRALEERDHPAWMLKIVTVHTPEGIRYKAVDGDAR